MIRIKLTDQDGYTRRGKSNETRWQIGVTVHANSSKPPLLCTAGVIHGYETPLLAVMMNPAHANISNPRGFQIEVPEVAVTDGTKEGYRSATPIKEIQLPVVSVKQKVRFGILCALEVFSKPFFVNWAQKWLSGEDRSSAAAAYADWQLNAATYAVNATATTAATAAARAATTTTASTATYAAATAANAAAYATNYATKGNEQINFAVLAQKAFDEEKEG